MSGPLVRFPSSGDPQLAQMVAVINAELNRKEPLLIGVAYVSTNLVLRFRAPYSVGWVQVQVQSSETNKGGMTYSATLYVSSTLVDCRADRLQTQTIALTAGVSYAVFLVPVQYDGAGVKVLYDGLGGRPDYMASWTTVARSGDVTMGALSATTGAFSGNVTALTVGYGVSMTNVPQLLLGGNYQASIGGRYAGGDLVIASNALQDSNVADHWIQATGSQPSWLVRMGLGGDFNIYHAAAGRTAGTMSAFWASEVFNLTPAGALTLAAGLTATGVDAFVGNALSAANDAEALMLQLHAGADGTLGALGFGIFLKPSAVAANRVTILDTGDATGYRKLRVRAVSAEFFADTGTTGAPVTIGALTATTAKLTALGAFAGGDKYVVVDASGNLHVSALGPAS